LYSLPAPIQDNAIFAKGLNVEKVYGLPRLYIEKSLLRIFPS
jgi:hypothetical protein